jgi:hypothetical protein
MKLLAGILACTIALSAALPFAAARDRRPTYRDNERGQYSGYRYRRSSTVGPNGACQRDTGRPLDSLNLNAQCDREEFWARMNDRGGGDHH